MQTDVEIAQAANLKPIGEIAAGLGLRESDYEPYGHDKAKINLAVLADRQDRPDGRLILCTAINPTAAGEGKTTTNVGLSMALNRIGKRAMTTLREPSLGPCFGMKGGAAGGGYAQVVPMDDINLHFTGDFHAITSAHNLLSALLDNSIHQGNPLDINPKRIVWKRVLDMNDRALRNIVVGRGKVGDGVVRESGFEITVASEIMAALCLATSLEDLKERFGRIIVAYTYDRQPVTAAQLEAPGAMALLMKDAVKPNLVQTLENTPAIIHGGPFANIAHGNNSVLATRTALKLADYVVTEAGFGADLGAEKFIDIKCRTSGLRPAAVVLVATVRALKYHGGVAVADLATENVEALRKGAANLRQHLYNIRNVYNLPVVVALNRFPTDTDAEVEEILKLAHEEGVRAYPATHFTDGGKGAQHLANGLLDTIKGNERAGSGMTFVYDDELPLLSKAEAVARKVYGASGITVDIKAKRRLERMEADGYGSLPVCMAKTQYSFSTDAKSLGAPKGHTVHIRQARLNAGAGFVVLLTGEIMTMPGLPREPASQYIDVTDEGTILGLS